MPSAAEHHDTSRNIIAVEVAVRRADLQQLTPLVALVGADNVTVRTDITPGSNRRPFGAVAMADRDTNTLVTFRLDDAERAHLLRRALAETTIGAHGSGPQAVRVVWATG